MVSASIANCCFLITIIVIIPKDWCGETSNSRSTVQDRHWSDAITETTTTINDIKHNPNAVVDMEIIRINVLPQFGNAVELFWDKPISKDDSNWTYAVYYGLNKEEAFHWPKLTTTNASIMIDNLDYCQKYVFAVGMVPVGHEIDYSPTNIRSIGTSLDKQAPPQNLLVDFLAGEYPCLIIKWSASCANTATPLGYLVTVHERNSAHMMIITVPETTKVDLIETIKADYGQVYDVKVATDYPGSNSTDVITYRVPYFLQPYKVRLTSQPDGTFMMYWREPYVPHYIGEYYYDVYVYAGTNLTIKPIDQFRINRPVFVYKGNKTEYTFIAGLTNANGDAKSRCSDPIAKSLYGESHILDVN